MSTEIIEHGTADRPMPLAPTKAADELEIIRLAIERGMSPEGLAKLVDLQERMSRRQAEERFAEAIHGFQSEAPAVLKERDVNTRDGKLMYKFASYSDLKAVMRGLERKYGITTSFVDVKHEDGKITGACRVRVGSHYEDHTCVIAVPKGMNTNQAQDFGAAMLYFRRYAYQLALDVVTTDRDTDGVGLHDKISAEEYRELSKLFDSKVFNEKKFFEWGRVDRLEDLPASRFSEARRILNAKPDRKE